MIIGNPTWSIASPFKSIQDVDSGFFKDQNSYSTDQNGNASKIFDLKGFNHVMTSEKLKGLQEPRANIVLESYMNGVTGGINGEKEVDLNLVNNRRSRYSSQVNSDDPIQVQLLVETALCDSNEFEILSHEEVEEMKKQCRAITQSIEQTRQTLAIQSKFCETSMSVSILYSSISSNSNVPGISADRNSVRVEEDYQDLKENKRICEELAVKLFHLEKKLMIPQEKLLKHTAGILKIFINTAQGQGKVNSISEGIHTLSQPQDNFDPLNEDFLFDERSLYKDFNGIDTENMTPVSSEQIEAISRAEKKLFELNNKLKQIISKVNPEYESRLNVPPYTGNTDDSLGSLKIQLVTFEQSIDIMDLEQGKLKGQYDLLMSQFSGIVEQKEVLQRQIKQQRDQNSNSDVKKDAELNEKIEQLAQTTALLTKTKNELDHFQKQVKYFKEKLDEAQQKEFQNEKRKTKDSDVLRDVEENFRKAEIKTQEAEQRSIAARIELESRDKEISKLQEQLQNFEEDRAITNAELNSKIVESKSQILSLMEELAAAVSAREISDTAAKEKDRLLTEKERELDDIQMDIARLQTEVTIAKAELEGAYGSRAQRAAQVAANPAIQKELDRLISENNSLISEITVLKSSKTGAITVNDDLIELRKELTETIADYEQMTKASIEWEKEREQLETTIDSLQDIKEDLESQLSDEKLRWMGMKSPGLESLSPNSSSTGTTILKNEFKKMMRDMRAENSKILKAEQSERRRLEDELRNLKKSRMSQNPTSPL